jgi:hypothetical protein
MRRALGAAGLALAMVGLVVVPRQFVAGQSIVVDGSPDKWKASSLIRFADAETPNGVLNGTNRAFVLEHAPQPAASLILTRNGIVMKGGLDYTLSDASLEFVAEATPQEGDVMLAWYRWK